MQEFDDLNQEFNESQENSENSTEKSDRDFNNATFFGGNAPQNSYNGYNDGVKYVPVFVPQPPSIEEIEKKAIKKTALLSGLVCLMMTGITLFWSYGYFLIMGLVGFSREQAYNIATDPFVLQIIQIIISTIMFTLPFILVYKLAGFKIGELVALEKSEKGTFLPLTLMGVGFCSFANIAVSIAGSIFEGFGVDYSVDRADDPEGFLGFLITFISTAIVPPLVEEFGCRGFILGSLRKFGDGFAIIVSAFIFGLIHGNFEQIPFAFLVGVILGFATVKSGSIWIAVIIHAINNGISVLADFLLRFVDSEYVNVFYNVYLMAALFIGILGAIIFAKRKSDAFSLKKSDTVSDELTKHKWFFTQPLIIILIIACLIESLQHFF